MIKRAGLVERAGLVGELGAAFIATVGDLVCPRGHPSVNCGQEPGGRQGKHEEALKVHGSELEIQLKVLGLEHPDFVKIVQGLGV